MVTENTDQPIEDVAQTQPADVVATAAEAPSAKTFSQDEVNRMMAQTKRDTRQQYSDYNDLQKRAARADELEHDKLTDTEKLEARAVEAERKATDAQQQIASAMIASEVKVRAITMGIVDPDAAFLLLDRSNVHYNADTGVSGVDDALTNLIEAKPYLRSNNRTPNINPESGQPVTPVRLTAQQREAAQYMGLTDEEYAQGI
jgi:hypothetical protein